MSEIIIPDFIKNAETNAIHQQMRKNLPDTLDCSEGSHPWNLTYPHAYGLSYFAQHILLNTIKLIWPEFSWGIYLDYHARARMMERKRATYATGYITVTGDVNTFIPEGSIFSTESSYGESATKFETTAAAVIDNSKTQDIPIAAVIPGKSGNVAAGTITINEDHIKGIYSVTNNNPTDYGIDEESDIKLSERICEYDRSSQYSFTGNPEDYRRWAKSVTGVGDAIVITPDKNPDVEDNSGIVTIIAFDTDGKGVSTKICADIYNYIMAPTPLSINGTEPENMVTGTARLAPPNARLIVKVPDEVLITVSAVVEVDGTQSIDSIRKLFISKLQEYLPIAISEKEIKHSRICRCLSQTDGVNDYKEVKLNNGVSNIPVTATKLPVVSSESITLNVGEVV